MWWEHIALTGLAGKERRERLVVCYNIFAHGDPSVLVILNDGAVVDMSERIQITPPYWCNLQRRVPAMKKREVKGDLDRFHAKVQAQSAPARKQHKT